MPSTSLFPIVIGNRSVRTCAATKRKSNGEKGELISLFVKTVNFVTRITTLGGEIIRDNMAKLIF